MNIDMWVCHFYVRAAELPRDVFQHIVIYVPVVAARRPETKRIADRAVAIAGEAGEDGFKIHTLGCCAARTSASLTVSGAAS